MKVTETCHKTTKITKTELKPKQKAHAKTKRDRTPQYTKITKDTKTEERFKMQRSIGLSFALS